MFMCNRLGELTVLTHAHAAPVQTQHWVTNLFSFSFSHCRVCLGVVMMAEHVHKPWWSPLTTSPHNMCLSLYTSCPGVAQTAAPALTVWQLHDHKWWDRQREWFTRFFIQLLAKCWVLGYPNPWDRRTHTHIVSSSLGELPFSNFILWRLRSHYKSCWVIIMIIRHVCFFLLTLDIHLRRK